MLKEYIKVTTDLSDGDAYKYTRKSKINTSIKFRRTWNGATEKGNIKGLFDNLKTHNIVFMIKKGNSIKEVYEFINR
jgi:hypothetical protein